MPRLISLIGLLLAACFAVPAAASATFDHDDDLWLDSYAPTSPSQTAGPVTSAFPLKADKYYVVEVRGTYSVWGKALWDNPSPLSICGKPEKEPIFQSPGRPVTPVGVDAEFLFARFASTCTPPPTGPLAVQFLADFGSGYSHPVAKGAPFTKPARDHEYEYLVKGQGVPASFKIHDPVTGDNSGVLKIDIDRAKIRDCDFDKECIKSFF